MSGRACSAIVYSRRSIACVTKRPYRHVWTSARIPIQINSAAPRVVVRLLAYILALNCTRDVGYFRVPVTRESRSCSSFALLACHTRTHIRITVLIKYVVEHHEKFEALPRSRYSHNDVSDCKNRERERGKREFFYLTWFVRTLRKGRKLHYDTFFTLEKSS